MELLKKLNIYVEHMKFFVCDHQEYVRFSPQFFNISKRSVKTQWAKDSIFKILYITALFVTLGHKEVGLYYSHDRSWLMRESKKDKQSWSLFQFLVNKTRALAANSQSKISEIYYTQKKIWLFVDKNRHLMTQPCSFYIKCYCNSEICDQHGFCGQK